MNVEKLKDILWRFIRGLVAGGVAQVALLIDWQNPLASLSLFSDPEKLKHVVISAFIAGVVLAFGKWLRHTFGEDPASKVNKLPF
jgi:hypothetical protein